MLRQPAPVSALAWGDAGAWLASAHSNRVLRIFDADTRRLAATLRGPEAAPSLLLAEGPRLVVASQDRRLRVYDVPTRQERVNLEVGARAVTGACLGDGGAVAATVAMDNCVRFWDLDFGRELAALWGAAGESFASIALSGRLVVVTLADGRIRLWEAATGA
jgi:WD40 repeat protein